MPSRKGSKNKHTFHAEEIAQRLNCNPLEVLLMGAKGDWKALGYEAECYFKEGPDGAVKMGYVLSPELRMNAAEKACRYLYSQKQAIQHSTGPEGVEITLKDYTRLE